MFGLPLVIRLGRDGRWPAFPTGSRMLSRTRPNVRLFLGSLRNASSESVLRGYLVQLRAIDQLDIGHWRLVTGTIAALDDSQIPPRPNPIARAKLREQLCHAALIAKPGECDPPIGDTVDLGTRDQWLNDSSKLLGFRQRRSDQLMPHERNRHVAKHRVIVTSISIEMPAGFSMSHDVRSSSTSAWPAFTDT